MIAAECFVNFLEEVGPFLLGDTANEGSADTRFIQGAFNQEVAPGAVFNAMECDGVVRLLRSIEEGNEGTLQSGVPIGRTAGAVSSRVSTVG